jgi:hypothetical protein
LTCPNPPNIPKVSFAKKKKRRGKVKLIEDEPTPNTLKGTQER